ncbi:MAG TPA: ABC transporter permease [Gaiellaceae bacterium]
MTRYLIRRLLWAVLLFFAVTVVSYILFFVIPADPARQFAGKGATPATIAKAKHYLHLDEPIYQQYGRFVWRLIYHHDLGHSYYNRESVNHIITDAAPVTASLVLGGAFFWMLIAIPIGVLSALRPRSLLDRGAMTFVLIGISAHPVWIGLIFAWFFGFYLHQHGSPIYAPISNYADFFNPPPGQPGGPVQWAYHLILPWLTFMILFAALYVRMIRANVMETLNEDYVRTARAKGAPESQVLRSHVLRNAMLPVVTMLGMDIGLALGGAIFTESVYGLPGLGRTAVQALQNYDTPTIMGVIVFATIVIIVFNLVVDLLYAAIDPRIRLA